MSCKSRVWWTLGVTLTLLSSLNCSGKAVDQGDGDGDGDGDDVMGDGDDMSTGGDMNAGGTGGQPGGIEIGTGGLVEDTTPIGQVDMLFVIDNSVSMADKQEMLSRAIPEMVGRMVDPPCIGPDGEVTAAVDGECVAGASREYSPIDDIHLGIISSSLGGHGARQCPRAEEGWNNDDQAHLIPTVRDGVTSGEPLGFLSWMGGNSAAAAALISDFSEQVIAVGETGCGFEAPLEAFYRFLVDPQPPEEIIIESGTSRAVMSTDANGDPIIDTELLAQREAFLRPESLVNVVIVTDENDCSAMDGGSYYNNAGFGYLVSEATFQMPIATSVCEANPNDACCYSCLQASNPPSGCESFANECSGGTKLPPEQDRANVRCYENKRRFGVDLLYPTDRYVKGLRDREIIDARNGEVVYNPLLTGVGANQGTVRPHGRVYFTGIVGVPWQDLVTQASLEEPETFEYLSADEIAAPTVDVGGQMVSRWEVILGKPGRADSSHQCQEDPTTPGCGDAPVPPYDPFMIASIEPRTTGAANPISGDEIVANTSTNPLANNINGHEANHEVLDAGKYPDGGAARDDLQYACIFELETPKADCDEADLSCDCGDEPLRNRSLCQPPEGGAAGNTQYFAKAYPGIRILEVLRDYGSNSVVSSICPKTPADGYTPAITTIIRRMKERFPVVR